MNKVVPKFSGQLPISDIATKPSAFHDRRYRNAHCLVRHEFVLLKYGSGLQGGLNLFRGELLAEGTLKREVIWYNSDGVCNLLRLILVLIYIICTVQPITHREHRFLYYKDPSVNSV